MLQSYRYACVVVVLMALAGCGGSSGPPSAVVNDTATTNEGSPVSIDVLANDTAVSPTTLRIASQPGNGVVTISGIDLVYTPATGFAGQDSFSYGVTGTSGTSLTGMVTVDVNAPPVANADSFSVVENTPTTLDILANDTDSDGTLTGGITIVSPPNGTLTVKSDSVSYTPAQGFVGADTFSYQVTDNQGAASNTAQVSISVTAITQTSLTLRNLTVPQSGYAFTNSGSLNKSLFSSPPQTLDIPPNTVSFVLMLRGTSVGNNTGLFISNLTRPDGTSITFRNAMFCDSGMCSADVPKRPDIPATAGPWQFELGTNQSNLDNFDLSGMQLQAAIRVGPAPDPTAAYPATFDVHPFLTAATISSVQLQPVLDALVKLAGANQIKLTMDPLTIISDPQYAEVSSDFTDPTTAALVSMGDAGKVNLFFLDSFTGSGGAASVGISPGIPGSLGVKSNLNGVLINATATYGGSTSYYARTTAEFSLHEIGHLLGLFHTTEQHFATYDILDDTPECTAADDTNQNGIADVSECPDGLNLLFWTNDFSQTKDPLTSDQRTVLVDSVLAVP